MNVKVTMVEVYRGWRFKSHISITETLEAEIILFQSKVQICVSCTASSEGSMTSCPFKTFQSVPKFKCEVICL